MMYDMNKLTGLRWWIDMYTEDIDKVHIIIIEKSHYCVLRTLARVCNKDRVNNSIQVKPLLGWLSFQVKR